MAKVRPYSFRYNITQFILAESLYASDPRNCVRRCISHPIVFRYQGVNGAEFDLNIRTGEITWHRDAAPETSDRFFIEHMESGRKVMCQIEIGNENSLIWISSKDSRVPTTTTAHSLSFSDIQPIAPDALVELDEKPSALAISHHDHLPTTYLNEELPLATRDDWYGTADDEHIGIFETVFQASVAVLLYTIYHPEIRTIGMFFVKLIVEQQLLQERRILSEEETDVLINMVMRNGDIAPSGDGSTEHVTINGELKKIVVAKDADLSIPPLIKEWSVRNKEALINIANLIEVLPAITNDEILASAEATRLDAPADGDESEVKPGPGVEEESKPSAPGAAESLDDSTPESQTKNTNLLAAFKTNEVTPFELILPRIGLETLQVEDLDEAQQTKFLQEIEKNLENQVATIHLDEQSQPSASDSLVPQEVYATINTPQKPETPEEVITTPVGSFIAFAATLLLTHAGKHIAGENDIFHGQDIIG